MAMTPPDDRGIPPEQEERFRLPPQEEVEFLHRMEDALAQQDQDVIEQNVERLQNMIDNCQERIDTLTNLQDRAREIVETYRPPQEPREPLA